MNRPGGVPGVQRFVRPRQWDLATMQAFEDYRAALRRLVSLRRENLAGMSTVHQSDHGRKVCHAHHATEDALRTLNELLVEDT